MRLISEKIRNLIFGWNERPLTERDFYQLCKRFKVNVVEMPLRTNGFYYRVMGRDYIAIDSRLTGTEKLLVQFHELAHLLLHTPESGATANFHGVGRKTRPELEADAIALCSLIPRTLLEDRDAILLCEDDGFSSEILAARFEILAKYGF